MQQMSTENLAKALVMGLPPDVIYTISTFIGGINYRNGRYMFAIDPEVIIHADFLFSWVPENHNGSVEIRIESRFEPQIYLYEETRYVISYMNIVKYTFWNYEYEYTDDIIEYNIDNNTNNNRVIAFEHIYPVSNIILPRNIEWYLQWSFI